MTEVSEKKDPGQAVTGGSLASAYQPPEELTLTQAFGREALIKVGVLGMLLAVMNLSLLRTMVTTWYTDSGKWGYAFVIPLFSLFLLYSRRAEIYAAPRRSSIAGLFIMLLGIAGELLHVLMPAFPGSLYVSQVCVVITLFGLVLYLGGWKLMWIVWLPILFLLFAVPMSDSIYTRIALPLQKVAARGAVVMLSIFIDRIESSSSMIELFSRSGQFQKLTVAEACSGMHLLLAFLALGVAMAYLEDKPIWQRVVLVLAAIPIAVFCNVIRVAITATMYYIDKKELGDGFMHKMTGVVMIVPAFGMLWLLGWLLKLVFVEVEDEDAAPGKSGGAAK